MDLGLGGRTAIVTGASRGIGLAVTRGLVAEGARVIAGALKSSAELDDLAGTGMVRAVEVDLAQPGGPARSGSLARPRATRSRWSSSRWPFVPPPRPDCPVLAVGAQAYLGDQVSRQLAHVASDVRGAVITESGHNIALENPSALAQAYLDFFAGQLIESPR